MLHSNRSSHDRTVLTIHEHMIMSGPFDKNTALEILKNQHNRSGSTHSSNSSTNSRVTMAKSTLAEKLRLDLSQIKDSNNK